MEGRRRGRGAHNDWTGDSQPNDSVHPSEVKPKLRDPGDRCAGVAGACEMAHRDYLSRITSVKHQQLHVEGSHMQSGHLRTATTTTSRDQAAATEASIWLPGISLKAL